MAHRKNLQPEQIIPLLKRHESGERISDLCREVGISEPTLYKWKAKYGGMDLPDARRLKMLETENRRLKQIVADQTLDIQALKAVNSKNFLRPE